jgi:hypothetical protein
LGVAIVETTPGLNPDDPTPPPPFGAVARQASCLRVGDFVKDRVKHTLLGVDPNQLTREPDFPLSVAADPETVLRVIPPEAPIGEPPLFHFLPSQSFRLNQVHSIGPPLPYIIVQAFLQILPKGLAD